MPQELIVIFLLFFAVLAFGWFYWQRAKGRAVETTSTTTAATAEEQPADPATQPNDPPA